MASISDYIAQTAARFAQADLCYGHGTDNASDEAYYLTLAALGMDFIEADENRLAAVLGGEQKALLDQLVQRRIEEQIPVAYLVGQAWFAGHRFISDQRALVPRSPIAELILNEFAGLLSKPPRRVLDLCCGGGCIGISVALQFNQAEVVLSDISAPALDLANENCRLHGLDKSSRLALWRSDLFENVPGPFDLILSNPPYVPMDEWRDLPREFRQEPESGLVSPDQGLAIPLRILEQASAYLSDDGLLIMEVGYSAHALTERLPDLPMLWLEFESGGSGVFALTAAQLKHFGASLA